MESILTHQAGSVCIQVDLCLMVLAVDVADGACVIVAMVTLINGVRRKDDDSREVSLPSPWSEISSSK